MTNEDEHGQGCKKPEDEKNKTNKNGSKTKEELDIEFKKLAGKLKTMLNKPAVELRNEKIIKPEKIMSKSKEELDIEFKELAIKLKTRLKK